MATPGRWLNRLGFEPFDEGCEENENLGSLLKYVSTLHFQIPTGAAQLICTYIEP